MIHKIGKILLKEYDYKLDTYKVLYKNVRKNKLLIPSIILFLIVATIYFSTGAFDFIVFAFSFFLLVIIPLALKKDETYDMVVITPEFIIKQTSKKKVTAIKFDEIKKFGTDKTGIVLKDGPKEISLNLSVLAEDILIIMDILEAKGKTFDKTKDYMIRPIKIIITDDDIKIVDVKITESSTDSVVLEHYGSYEMLTPGFIEDIILLNSVIEEAYFKDNHFYMKISRIEVKPGHPENTSFESQIAIDCILILEHTNILKLIKKGVSGSKAKVLEDKDNFAKDIKKGVIADWKCRQNEIDLEIYVEQYVIDASFEYEEVVVGWNKFI